MKNCKTATPLLGMFFLLLVTGQNARSQEKASQEKATPKTVQVHVVITDAALREDNELPPLQKET
jgi:hypothetical protein